MISTYNTCELKNNRVIVINKDFSSNEIGHCIINVNVNSGTWQISSWYVKSGYQHQGIGKRMMDEAICKLIHQYGFPKNVEYVWNGANRYVKDWLDEHFLPVSKCDISVQKNNSDDDWNSHIYILNVFLFFSYFGIQYKCSEFVAY